MNEPTPIPTPEPEAADKRFPDSLLRSAPSRAHQSDQVRISLDWLPSVSNNITTFLVGIVRGKTQSSITFEIDLHQLSTDELKQLHAILVARHSATDTATIAGHIAYLLELSICQAQPNLSRVDRQLKVRELLLCRDPKVEGKL